ncbi:MAG: Uma2 family endonuclease [Bacteroidota bacterium]
MFKVKEVPIHHPDYDKYPSSDGELMAETTRHARWIKTIDGNVRALTEGQDIFVASDLLWYPVEGRVNICKAPDVMVAIGRPKGDRDTYLQWLEDNVAPQVVFEIFSRTNHRRVNKENLLEFYTKYGVQEYYIYDPIRNTFTVYLRQGDKLTRLEGLQKWVSPLLGIRFEWSEKSFEIYRPNGERFLTFEELEREKKYLERKASETEKQLKIAWLETETEVQKTKDAERKAAAEAQRAETEAQRAQAAENRQRLLEEKLRAMGIDPNAIGG